MSLFITLFGEKYEKNWYNHGKLLSDAFKNWQKNVLPQEQSRYVNDFIEKNIYDCNGNDIETIKTQIQESENKISKLSVSLKENNTLISRVSQDIKKESEEDLKILENKYKIYISENTSQIDKIKTAADDYMDYILSSKSNIQSSINKKVWELYEQIDYVSLDIKSYFDNPKKLDNYEKLRIEANNWLVDNYTTSNFSDKIKDFWLLFMFLVTIFFDYILWKSVMSDYLMVWTSQAKLWSFTWIASSFLAIWFVLIIILFLHFAPNPFEENKDKKKQIWFAIFFYVIVFIVFAYWIILSIPKWMTIMQWFWRENDNLLELILRILLIPTVYLWEIILCKINWNNIIDIIKTPFRFMIIPFRYWNYMVAMITTKAKAFFAKLNIVKEYEKSIIDRQSLQNSINKNINLDFTINQTSQIIQNIKYIYENYQNKINEFESEKNKLVNEIDNKILKETLEYQTIAKEIDSQTKFLQNEISSKKSYINYIIEQTRKWMVDWLYN